jgi:hypothetical protein
MWFNRNEIPWNGADDDGNGYTDDYRGWNGGDSNNRTFTTQSIYAHGTEVAGIMGAAGNNNTGVCGINWQTKLMPLLCYPINGVNGDLGVIRSMLYALRMKKLYMATGGQKGALIMAVNRCCISRRAAHLVQSIRFTWPCRHFEQYCHYQYPRGYWGCGRYPKSVSEYLYHCG